MEDKLPFVAHRAPEWPVSLASTLATHSREGMEAKYSAEISGRPSETAKSCRLAPLRGPERYGRFP